MYCTFIHSFDVIIRPIKLRNMHGRNDRYLQTVGHAVAQLVEALRYRKVAGSIPDGVIGIFH